MVCIALLRVQQLSSSLSSIYWCLYGETKQRGIEGNIINSDLWRTTELFYCSSLIRGQLTVPAMNENRLEQRYSKQL